LRSIQEAIANAAPVDAEIIVVDNGSTDETAAVLKKWASGCRSVQLLSEPNRGLSRARCVTPRPIYWRSLMTIVD
jgi:glycosyltransferase involved in cell wall biosynthesis